MVQTLRSNFGTRWRVLSPRRRRKAGRCFRVFSHLLEMRAHRAPGHVGVVPLDRLKNAFVMNLSALWSAFHVEDSYALLAQQTDNGVDQGKNQRISDRFRQR